jgi:glucokinase
MTARRVIGVDLGGTKLLAGVVDPGLGVHHRTQRPVVGLDQQALLDVAVDAVTEGREAAGVEIEGVGFGLPVLMDRRGSLGTAVVGVNTPLHDLAFADVMAERIGLPVFVDNDGNTSALAEHRAGAAHGASDAIVITLGTGIAGGLILGDELYRGAFGAAGELGHMVIELDGPPCHGQCPNHGCAEVYCSGTALVDEARRLGAIRPGSGLERLLRNATLAGPLVTELAHDGDAAAREAIELIGGGVIAAGELVLAPARAVVAERVLPFLRESVPIVAARFGVEAGMVGAAALAFDEIARGAMA